MGTSPHASPRVSDLWDVSWEKWRARVPPQGCRHSSWGPTKRSAISAPAVTGGQFAELLLYASGATTSFHTC